MFQTRSTITNKKTAMVKLLRYIHDPMLLYLKLSQLFGILPFMIVCDSEEETSENILPGRELRKWIGSKTGMKYKVKFSAALMTWCVAIRLVIAALIGLLFIEQRKMDEERVRVGMIISFLHVLGGFTMPYSLTNHKAMINSILKMSDDDEQEIIRKFRSVKIALLLQFVSCTVPLLSLWKDKVTVSWMIIGFITSLWVNWNSNFYKHLCSCMKIKVMKIQHNLRNVKNDDAQKLLDEINKVRVLLSLFLKFIQCIS